jgi:hypothetical protein
MNELRENGLEVNSNGVGFYVNNLYVETSSVTNIYNNGELVKSFKTPKSAINFLLKTN